MVCDDLILAVDHKQLLRILGDRKLQDKEFYAIQSQRENFAFQVQKLLMFPARRIWLLMLFPRHPNCDKDIKLLLPDYVNSTCDETCASPWNEFLNERRLLDTSHFTSVDDDITVAAIQSLDDMQAVTWDRVREATSSDPAMFELLETIEQGMPDTRSKLPPTIRQYYDFREELSTVDGVILYKERIVIPPALRKEVLSALHAAHQGVTSMTARANMSVFWPGITAHIANLRERCADCNRIAPSQPNGPPTPLLEPEYPFQCICADFFTYKGIHYLIIVDRYSNWPTIKRTSRATGLISSLREEFVTYGVPEELSSDGGPEFVAAETQKFLKAWGIHHRISSVAFPHSNCRAEIGVKTCKRLIMSNTGPNGELDVPQFQQAILQYRNSPDQDTKMSPAMIVFGRCVRDLIPVLPGKYKPQQAWLDNAGLRESALRKRYLRAAERLSTHTKRLPPLRVGDHVRVQNQVGNEPLRWDKTGIVVEVRQHDQYVVRIDGSGRVTVRNWKFLRKFSLYEPSKHCPMPAKYLAQGQGVVTTSPPMKAAREDVPTPSNIVELTPDTSTGDNVNQPKDETPVGNQDSPANSQHETETVVSPPSTPAAPVDRIKLHETEKESSVPASPNVRTRPKRTIKPPKRYDPAEWDR